MWFFLRNSDFTFGNSNFCRALLGNCHKGFWRRQDISPLWWVWKFYQLKHLKQKCKTSLAKDSETSARKGCYYLIVLWERNKEIMLSNGFCLFILYSEWFILKIANWFGPDKQRNIIANFHQRSINYWRCNQLLKSGSALARLAQW